MRFDTYAFSRLTIIANQSTILPLRIDRIGIFRIDRWIESITKHRDEPITVANPVDIVGARGSTLRGIVLRSAVDVVERFIIGDGDFVKLSDR